MAIRTTKSGILHIEHVAEPGKRKGDRPEIRKNYPVAESFSAWHGRPKGHDLEDVMRDSAQSEIRKLELEAARIAKRRQRHDERGLDLAEAERLHQATLENFVLEGIRAAGLTRLPLSDLLDKIKALGAGTAAQEGGSDPANDPRSVKPFGGEVDRDRQVVFVKITRNLSADNRRAIEEHGLRWNGKRGGWKV
jgi:hypothetical protein